ncbi:MAG: hypothetical protein ACQESR_01065 [Planctomycetota bacterium]
MSRLLVAATLASICVVCGGVWNPAVAQRRAVPTRAAGGYGSVQTPRLSPYLDLLRTRVGVLDNYNAIVRPQLQLRNTLNQQQRQLSRQQHGLRQLENEVRQPQRDSSATATGIGGSFGNYLHFYPGNKQRR